MLRPLLFLRSIPRKLEKVWHFYCLTRYKHSLTVDLPSHVEVEATKRCNATCGTCTRGYLDQSDTKNDLQPSTIARILDAFPNLTSIRLAGLGEVFLNPHIETILQQLKARSIRIWIITNGSLLLDAQVRQLIHRYIDDVAISIDSTDAAEFSRLRPMGKIGLPEVLDGTRLLIEERNAGQSNTTIGISATITKENYLALPAIGKLCTELAVDYAAIAFVENWMVRGDPNFQETSDLVHSSLQEFSAIRATIQQTRRQLLLRGIAVGHKIPHRRIGKCYWPYKATHITSEGLLTPCCTRVRKNHALFDFLNTQDFSAAWNGPEYQALRFAHAQKDTLHPICGDCPL